MSRKVLLFEQDARLRRVALLEAGRLTRLLVEPVAESLREGTILRARVTARASGHGGAFLDLDGTPGFLPRAGDAAPGDSLLAQIRRAPGRDKAARVATALEHEGRLLIFTPAAPGINVSRRIADPSERERLKAALARFGEAGGFVIRTAAQGAEAGALAAEAEALLARHRALEADPRFGVLLPGPDVFVRAAARWPLEGASAEADPEAHDRAALALEGRGIPLARADSPFDHHDAGSAVAALLAPRVALPGGGWMSVEPTAALVAVDVNTGAAPGGDAVGRVNEAAAAELPRQLALRALGGAVAVDFAAGPKGRARARIEAVFARAAREDENGLRALGWGPAGLFEATRRKPGRSLAETLEANP